MTKHLLTEDLMPTPMATTHEMVKTEKLTPLRPIKEKEEIEAFLAAFEAIWEDSMYR